MRTFRSAATTVIAGIAMAASAAHAQDAATIAVPRFSIQHMDRTVSPRTNFFLFANGTWVRNNPVPADKARVLLERGFERRTRAA